MYEFPFLEHEMIILLAMPVQVYKKVHNKNFKNFAFT